MRLEVDGKTFYSSSFLGGGKKGWAENIMKNTLREEQNRGTLCYLLTDGKDWHLMVEYENGKFKHGDKIAEETNRPTMDDLMLAMAGGKKNG